MSHGGVALFLGAARAGDHNRIVRSACALAAVALGASGCAALGVIDDGTSVSWGRADHGAVTNPARLPDHGDGYRVPPQWRDRGLRYGTDELVDLIISVSRHFAMDWPGSRVTVADMSPAAGGQTQWHRSHQSGRDVDLVFFVTDVAGRPVDPDTMRHFGADGFTTDDATAPRLVFDVERNWTLVRDLIESQGAQVQRIFIFEPLRQMLLDHARDIGESEWLIQTASELLHQPSDSAPHDDHMHVRIFCSSNDAPYGCEDYGNVAIFDRKVAKAGMIAWGAWAVSLREMLTGPAPAMVALVGLPILP